MRECGVPTFRSSDRVLASGEAGRVPDERIGRRKISRRGVTLGVSISARAGFLSRCVVTRVNPLAFTQDQLYSGQPLIADAASYDRQTSS
jgi:hypothetical protein